MKALFMAVFLGLAVFGLTACGSAQKTTTTSSTNQQAASAYHKISAQEAKAMMDKGNVTVVDVRTPAEYADGHIPQAILLPLDEVDQKAESVLKNKKDILLVYCRSGRRSKVASDKLVEKGYQQVFDFGGINDWPYAVTKGK